jgi:uncharacterized integral membrane protein
MFFRLLLLLGLAGGLVVFAQSNWATVLTLTILGVQTPAFPLAVWVLGAIAAGFLTNLLISLLVHLASYATARKVRAKLRQSMRQQVSEGWFKGKGKPAAATQMGDRSSTTNKATDTDTAWQDWEGYEQYAQPQRPDPNDWEAKPSDDWEAKPTDRTQTSQPVPPATAQASKNFESNQTPKNVSRSGSTYSYTYRESNQDPVHQKEEPAKPEPAIGKPVVDAEYRVITPPPPRPPEPVPEPINADDWFEDDDAAKRDREQKLE